LTPMLSEESKTTMETIMSSFEVRYVRDIDPLAIDGRLIRNPNYGGPSVGPHGWTWRVEISKHGKENFQDALTASIREDGVRNPILLYAFSEGIYLTFGGSRVRAAREAGVPVPAIVNDYAGRFEDCPLVGMDTVESFFTDPPRDYEFGPDGFDYHYNLERARRANHDPSGFAWLGDTPAWIATEFPWLIEE
jgi:hypothetical protein